jgi:Mg2+-importing ATPase
MAWSVKYIITAGRCGHARFLERADAALVRDARVLTVATSWQVAIFLLDAATVWVCIRSLGATARPAAVFASFMISSLVRTMGVMPGGLGTYEAASVLTLRLAGISLSAALSATLIFRGLSFWIPMLPGFWASRQVMKAPR